MAELKKLLNKQNTTYRVIERFWENLQKAGKDKLTPVYLNTRIRLLDGYWDSIQSTHLEILEYDESNNSEYCLTDQIEKIEESYVTARSRTQALLTPEETKTVNPRGRNPDEPSAAALMQQLLIPKTEMPKFSGQKRDWEGFRDLFTSLVHDVQGITTTQKLQLLRSSLTGDAARSIQGFETNDAGYRAAWDALVEQYDAKRDIESYHMKVLIRLPAQTKPSAAAIRKMISTAKQAYRALRNLKRPVEQWDSWFINLICEKLDSVSKMLWESSLKSKNEFPPYTQFIEFLETRARSLEAASRDSTLEQESPSSKSKLATLNTMAKSSQGALRCQFCKGAHTISFCNKFRSLPIHQRQNAVKKGKLCTNCLRPYHISQNCSSQYRCRKCQNRHHTLLHTNPHKQASNSDADANTSATSNSAASIAVNHAVIQCNDNRPILIATARVIHENSHGQRIAVRAFLDSGAQGTLITERVVQKLRLPKQRTGLVTLTGLRGTRTGHATHTVSVVLQSLYQESCRMHLAGVLVLPSLSSMGTMKRIKPDTWPHLRNLHLADPHFARCGPIDLFIGADLYGTPSAHLTTLGWVVMGRPEPLDENSDSVSNMSIYHTLTLSELGKQVEKFWAQNELTAANIQTPEEEYCETLFQNTHIREPSGRYSLRLPIRENSLRLLGDSRNLAVHQFLQLERRLMRNDRIRTKYSQFMDDYEAQDHMERVSFHGHDETTYYLPHHAVTKPSDPSGKIRVAFNASARSATGYTLNDCLLPGPKLEQELWLVLSRWRMMRSTFICDIVQMFRQINIQPSDQALQCIVWRKTPSSPLQTYRLTTVTYGTASAPYLAIRTLLQLAKDERLKFPLGDVALENHAYVDDILAGGDSIDQALDVQKQLIDILAAGGFRLSK